MRRLERTSGFIIVFSMVVFSFTGWPAHAGDSSGNSVTVAPPLVANVCEACHGKDGNSVDKSVPSLAGQGGVYLQRQVAAFQAQRRLGIMSGVAMGLNNAEIREAATYFSQQIAKPGANQSSGAGAPQRGEEIYVEGIVATQVPACASCHAMNGAGLPPEFPRLAGQHARYIAEQLRAFRSGNRYGNNAMMRKVSAKLSDQQIEAVADYIEHLH